MLQKDKISYYFTEIKKDPERYEKLREFAKSKLTEKQKNSSVYESLLDLKMREILSEYT